MSIQPFRALLLLLVAACGSDGSNASSTRGSDSPPTPTTESPIDEPDAAAALGVIHEYYAAIDSGAYRRAYMLWGDSGRLSDQTFAQFRAGFENTASVEVDAGEPGRIEGAAGSRYIQIPVRIEALTTDSAIQRFTGTYTLRRAVVEGASEAHERWHIYSAEISPCSEQCPDVGRTAVAVGDVIRRFGARLRMVSVLGPRDSVASAMREHYAPLVTPQLLAEWIDDPSAAPGRRVSNPWPQRIAITSVGGEGADLRVARGNIIYVASADTTSAVDEAPVTIRLVRGADRAWRISGVDW